MSSPRFEEWLLGRARPSVDARAARDLRIDTIRGLALLMIFINHIPQNPLTHGTLAAFVFNDAAEVFVLLAGYSAMLAYHRGFGGGLLAGAAPILRRVKTIYLVQVALALLLATAGLALAAATGRAFYLEHLDLQDFAEQPLVGVVAVFALLFQPSYADILPMYVVLMGALPLVVYGLMRSPLLTVAASAALYAAANIAGLNLPQTFEGSWYFNPFAWQLIFVVGAAAGHATLAGVTLPRSVDGVALAAAAVAFAIAVKAPWTALGFDGGWFTTLGVNYLDFSKTWGHPMRLLTLVSLAYLAALFLRADGGWLKGRVAGALQAVGRNSLPAFALGTALSFAGTAVLTEAGRGAVVVAVVNLAGILLILALPRAIAAFEALRPAVRPAQASGQAPRLRQA